MTDTGTLMDVDLLIFDLDDTLVNWAQRVAVARRRVAELLSARLSGSISEWLETLEERDGELWEKVVNGEVLQEEVAAIRMRRVVEKLNREHSTDDVIAEAIQIQHRTMLEEATVDEVVHDVLSSLRQGYCLYLLTNGVATLQWPTIRRLGLDEYFDEILICSELGSYKPHPQPFQETLSRAGCPPHRACMIGDSWHDDIQGAGQLGIKTIWLNYDKRPAPNGGTRADHIIGNLRELQSLFNFPER